MKNKVLHIIALLVVFMIAQSNSISRIHVDDEVSNAELDLNQFAFCTKTNVSQIFFDLSGVAYNNDTDRLVVVENGTPQAMELDLNGNYIRTINFNNFHDTEGIAYVGNNMFFVTEEQKRDIVLITIPPGNSNITINHPGNSSRINLGSTIGNVGLEGVAYDVVNDIIYVVKEKMPIAVYKVTNALARVGTTYSPPAAFDFNMTKSSYPGTYTDLAGTAITPFGTLLLLTQEGQHVVEVDPDSGAYLSDMSLSAAATPQPEGITVLNAGELVIVGEANEFMEYRMVGATCDDGNPCTENDVIDMNCNCTGIGTDIDKDGICDDQDSCPNLHNDLIGMSCNNGDPCTTNDIWQTNCQCEGTPMPDSDNDGVCDSEDNCPTLDNNLIGTACDDGIICTTGDSWQTNCLCEGIVTTDSDGDGICDAIDNCPDLNNNLIGNICSDGNMCTVGDTWRANCLCIGFQLQDSDFDGTCDIYDSCPQVDNALFGTACNDNDPCSLNDVWKETTCNCEGTTFDSDGDGICDGLDNCVYMANNDQLDSDNDGIGDVCQFDCAIEINQLDNYNMLPGTTEAVAKISTNRVLKRPRNSIYQAGQFVAMMSGFEVKKGATFIARIETCQ